MCVCVGGGRAQLYLSTFSVSETSSPLIWPKAKITKIFGHLIPYGIHHHKIWKTLFTLNTVWPILYMSAIKPAKSKDKQKLLTLHSLWNSSPQNSRDAFYTSHHMSWTVLVCHKTNQKEKQNRNFWHTIPYGIHHHKVWEKQQLLLIAVRYQAGECTYILFCLLYNIIRYRTCSTQCRNRSTEL